MTWCIFIATNYNLLFTHKQKSGKMDSGLWGGLHLLFTWEVWRKWWQRGGLGPVCMAYNVLGPCHRFPYLSLLRLLQSLVSNLRNFYRVAEEHTHSCSLEGLWLGFLCQRRCSSLFSELKKKSRFG